MSILKFHRLSILNEKFQDQKMYSMVEEQKKSDRQSDELIEQLVKKEDQRRMRSY